MRTTEKFATKAEADSFVRGLNYVGDLDVDSNGPYIDEDGFWVVLVVVGDDDEEEDEDL